MFWTLVLIYLFYAGLEIYASVNEIRFVSKAKYFKPIILSPENYTIAADYKIASEKFEIVNELYSLVVFFGWLGFGLKALEGLFMEQGAIVGSVFFVLTLIGVNYILGLPFSIYEAFFLDKKFGFSTITPKIFITDQIKAGLLFLTIGSSVLWAVSAIITNFEMWWIWGFCLIYFVIVFIAMVYPTWIAPIFNKLEPMEEGELRGAIEGLLQKAGLQSGGVFRVDASKRDNRLNAYFGGFGKTKRVVLFDTLIEKLSKNELLAVLGHELGHFKHGDIFKGLIINGVMLFVAFALFGNIPASVFEALGLQVGAHSQITLFLFFSPILFFLMTPINGIISRRNEYSADEYGSECESKEALGSALVKLADENKSFPLSPAFSIFLYFTHPPLPQRLEKLGMFKQEAVVESAN
ncbi:MAG: M48 family metallopeptidase [Sulfurospirillaceae bacterium]|nr:M48 family metallopeptidase [Sulfurospirillaceae bacterium]